MSLHDTERIVQDFLGDNPRASEWKALRQALSERLGTARLQRRQEAEEGASAARLQTLDTQIATLRRQVAALETEEAVSQFVEDSLKFTLARSVPGDDEELGDE